MFYHKDAYGGWEEEGGNDGYRKGEKEEEVIRWERGEGKNCCHRLN